MSQVSAAEGDGRKFCEDYIHYALYHFNRSPVSQRNSHGATASTKGLYIIDIICLGQQVKQRRVLLSKEKKP